jgi:serine phosphatase RsbU (regulator of sigma subunit)
MGSLVFYIRWRERALKARQKELEIKVDEATVVIRHQKEEVEEKNREILDSITYAKRIQSAILPPPRVVKGFLKNSFVLYLPKDIVAGDFYWMDGIDDCVYFAACDCTGHGVPGAMVSVVCNTALNRSLHEYELREPGKIFDKTRDLVIDNFSQSDDDVNDGMDASLCVLNIQNGILQWSGANNPLWIYRAATKEIEETKADKQPIGKSDDPKSFATREFQLNPGDIIYLFTDGYADQFGGEKGKKLTRARFRELLLSIASLDMEKQREALLKFHDEYRGNQEQIDDICVMGVRV